MPSIHLIPIDEGLARIVREGPDRFAASYGASPGSAMETIRDVVAQTLSMIEKDPRAPEWGGFLAIDRGERLVIGTCGFPHGPDESGAVEIAYFTFPQFEGRGYATAMAKELLRRALESEAVREAEAHTLPEKNASTRVLEKLGFEVTGEAHDEDAGRVWRWARRRET